MDEPQPVDHRRRLCALAGRLAGLRAWLLFDLADHRGADAWYDAAIRAANEAEDPALGGWLFGARSLIPTYQHNHAAALTFIARGQTLVERSGDTTVKTWLYTQGRAVTDLTRVDDAGQRRPRWVAEHEVDLAHDPGVRLGEFKPLEVHERVLVGHRGVAEVRTLVDAAAATTTSPARTR